MKRLALFCDGTWNSADQEKDEEPCPSNVPKLAFRVDKRDAKGVAQIVYYGQGVGTGNSVDRFTGGAFGVGLEDNLLAAYRFLIANYELGDEIFAFGFSRGAFTIRSLMGMVRKCGILDCNFARHYEEAAALYRSDANPEDKVSMDFRKTYCAYGDTPIDVQFLGVWDTVGSLGIPLRGLRWVGRKDFQFHDTELSGMIKNAFQALAVDEHRGPFEPAIWEYKPKTEQHVEQVWFCGAHSDVGGGYAWEKKANPGKDQSPFAPQLCDISLQWMMDKAAAAGLAFDERVIAGNPLEFDTTSQIHNSKTGMYRVVPDYDRVIGQARVDGKFTEDLDTTQSLHPSVLARWDKDASYRPESLKRYLTKIGDSRVK
jgi:uncharacterized protein (DUF2235 family)